MKIETEGTGGGKWTEASITIEGTPLTFAQSMTLRVALETFILGLKADGLGDDKTGKSMTKSYLARAAEISALIHGVR